MKTQDPVPSSHSAPKPLDLQVPTGNNNTQSTGGTSYKITNPAMPIRTDRDLDPWQFNDASPQAANLDDFNFNANMGLNMNNVGGNFTWEMIGLGLEEPLPPQETIDELHQVYFEKVHPSIPMIHKYRYLAAMNLYV